MSPLVIEYVLEGHQRGYNFTSPTSSYDDRTLKSIWRSAMPRGQGWSSYPDSRSIKGFHLPDGEIAVSEVRVTDTVDENGRRGIRRAVVDVMAKRIFRHHLNSRLAGYPPQVITVADVKYQQCKQRFPRLKKEMPLVLIIPYKEPTQWWWVEALVIKLTLFPIGAIQRREALPSFTTLALDYHSESDIVAIPKEKAAGIDIPYIDLSL